MSILYVLQTPNIKIDMIKRSKNYKQVTIHTNKSTKHTKEVKMRDLLSQLVLNGGLLGHPSPKIYNPKGLAKLGEA